MQLLEMERQSLLLEKEKRKIDMTNPEQIKKINLIVIRKIKRLKLQIK